MRCRTSGSSANRTICWIERLAAVVGGVALAGDHQLHRPLRVEQQRPQPLGVAQHQRQPLVGRHPAGEADGEHVRVEHVVRPAQLGLGRAPRSSHDARTRRRTSLDQLPAQRVASRPQIARRTGPAAAPSRGPPRPVRARRGSRARSTRGAAQVGACTPLVTEPIGTSVGVETRPQRREHLAADAAVQLGHAVGPLAEPQAHVRHVEHAPDPPRAPSARIRSTVSPGSSADSFARRAAEVAPDEVGREPVDSGGHRRVGGEHRAGPDRRERLVEVEAAPEMTSSRIRSMPRKPAWPSFMWKTSGSGRPSAWV